VLRRSGSFTGGDVGQFGREYGQAEKIRLGVLSITLIRAPYHKYPRQHREVSKNGGFWRVFGAVKSFWARGNRYALV